jgi:bifunctional UDP-N-acetylglucosamine pyrophosphorylase/glucosamine-1-phosphate N-acetyltransferase
LAAGKGTRMDDSLPKVLVPVKGRPMIEYLIQSIADSGVCKDPTIIVSPGNKDLIKEALKRYGCRYAIQNEQLGTGHALACAKGFVGEEAKNIIVFYGDHPFVKPQTIKKLAEAHKGSITMMTTELEDFNGWRKNFYNWGRIIRDGNKIKEIIEFKDANREEKEIKEVNPGFYCFNSEWLWENIKRLENKNAQKEYYLTDLIKIAFKQGLKIDSLPINPKEAIGINSKEELEIAEKLKFISTEF